MLKSPHNVTTLLLALIALSACSLPRAIWDRTEGASGALFTGLINSTSIAVTGEAVLDNTVTAPPACGVDTLEAQWALEETPTDPTARFDQSVRRAAEVTDCALQWTVWRQVNFGDESEVG